MASPNAGKIKRRKNITDPAEKRLGTGKLKTAILTVLKRTPGLTKYGILDELNKIEYYPAIESLQVSLCQYESYAVISHAAKKIINQRFSDIRERTGGNYTLEWRLL